jgi:ureidoglycolate hydrolase
VGDGRPKPSIFRSKPLEPHVRRCFERHPLGQPGVHALQKRPYLVRGFASAGAFDATAVRVFRAARARG